MTRLVRLNEVQYVETQYDIERLMSEGFAVEEVYDTETAEDEENPKRGGRKKAEA
jgi:hypothetical protein